MSRFADTDYYPHAAEATPPIGIARLATATALGLTAVKIHKPGEANRNVAATIAGVASVVFAFSALDRFATHLRDR